MDRLDIFKIRETGSLAPVQKLANSLVVRSSCIFVPDRDGEKLKEPLGCFWSHISDDCWNLKWFGFVKDQRTL
jgi:hypothetical protein